MSFTFLGNNLAHYSLQEEKYISTPNSSYYALQDLKIAPSCLQCIIEYMAFGGSKRWFESRVLLPESLFGTLLGPLSESPSSPQAPFLMSLAINVVPPRWHIWTQANGRVGKNGPNPKALPTLHAPPHMHTFFSCTGKGIWPCRNTGGAHYFLLFEL